MTSRDEILRVSRERQAESAQVSYEATIARRILQKLAPNVSLAGASLAKRGATLNLELVRDEIAGFPLRLTARNVGYLPTITVNDLFTGFMKTPIFRALMDHADAVGWTTNDRIGLVTGWNGLTTMVLHNLPRVEERIERHKGYARFTFVTSRGVTPEVYSLEPLDALLDAIREEL